MAKVVLEPFTMGTVSCPVCGFMFPLTTDCGSRHITCRHCRTLCGPLLQAEDAIFHFPSSLVASAAASISISTKKVVATGITATDSRVIEEAFCERCNTHRPCRTFARQTRSADEGQTIFLTCTVCKSEWSLNS